MGDCSGAFRRRLNEVGMEGKDSRSAPRAETLHLRLPLSDWRELREMIPHRFVDISEAARACLRRGIEVERGRDVG